MNIGKPLRLGQDRLLRHLPVMLLDVVLIFVAYALALVLRFDGNVPTTYSRSLLVTLPLVSGLHLLVNGLFGLHRRMWKYASLQDLISLVQACALSAAVIILSCFVFFSSFHPLPTGVIVIAEVLVLFTLGSARIFPRLRARLPLPGPAIENRARVLIVGSGNAGELLAREFLRHQDWRYLPVCFVDDDPAKHGMRIHGIPVLGDRHRIPELVTQYDIDEIAIAIPSAPGSVVRELATICQATSAKIQIVPGLLELMEGRVHEITLRELNLDDLLGRPSVVIDSLSCSQSLAGARVLVTGAAGSIGSELSRQLLRFSPAELVLVDNNESGLHDLGLELGGRRSSSTIHTCIADISNGPSVRAIFRDHHPQIVFHAAAYKHVPLMQQHVCEAVRVNVIGTRNLCLAAEEVGVGKFVFVSTDKAVNPQNVMGMTKRIGELIILSMAAQGDTAFCAVRFGNVVGSRGSVIPTFWRQIEMGGPVTVTHPEITRFFMTIPEAVTLVIQAAAFARAGDIFLLDMGDEIRILDLAHKMIRLKGLRPGRDIEVRISGLRPGEKLREELLAADEAVSKTQHPKIQRVQSKCAYDRETLLREIDELALYAEAYDAQAALAALTRLTRVPSPQANRQPV